MTDIPKLLHQLWIGDASKAPTRFMATLRDAHVPLGFEYIFWNEAEIARRSAENVEFAEALAMVQSRVEEMEESMERPTSFAGPSSRCTAVCFATPTASASRRSTTR